MNQHKATVEELENYCTKKAESTVIYNHSMLEFKIK